MKLQIVMSTYNGEQYLGEQLDSLLAQTLCGKEGAEVEILVRDDGSKDSTCDILQEYADKYACIRYFKEENVGVIESFFRLIDKTDADYVACCDQDDFWRPEKMEHAVAMIEQTAASGQKPVLYCGRPLLTDENLEPIETVWSGEAMRPSFGNAAIENICVGCTCVMNRELVNLLRLSHPDFTTMHDRWIYLIASCFGEVVYDTEPFIYYRQHGGNVVGMKKNHLQEFMERARNFGKRRHDIERQMQSFVDFCERHGVQIPEKNMACAKDILAKKKSLRARIRLIKNADVYRQRKGDHRIFMILILLGII